MQRRNEISYADLSTVLIDTMLTDWQIGSRRPPQPLGAFASDAKARLQV